MQAILTKHVAPTDSKGSRFKASCEAKTIYVAYDHTLGLEENHTAAAKNLCELLGWETRLVSGALPGNLGYAHVLLSREG